MLQKLNRRLTRRRLIGLIILSFALSVAGFVTTMITLLRVYGLVETCVNADCGDVDRSIETAKSIIRSGNIMMYGGLVAANILGVVYYCKFRRRPRKAKPAVTQGK
jgi:hypothetical protein